jgi:hypothetical protein
MSSKSPHNAIRALEGRPGAEYDEETFVHLLALERARAERAGQRVRLLLVTLEPTPGRPVPITLQTAARIFDGLKLLLRDTDVVGWYEQGRVAGAVLTAPADETELEASSVVEQRIGSGLRERLSSKIADELRVRVTQHGPRRVVRK